MNRVALATVHETQSRRWTTFTPPYTAAHTALHGLFLLRRSQLVVELAVCPNKSVVDKNNKQTTLEKAFCIFIVVPSWAWY